MDFEFLASHYNYYIVIILMMLGLYAVFSSGNMVKRLVGLGVFQASVFLFYITIGKVAGGQPPILPERHHGEDSHYEAQADHGATTAADHSDPAPDPAHDDDRTHTTDGDVEHDDDEAGLAYGSESGVAEPDVVILGLPDDGAAEPDDAPGDHHNGPHVAHDEAIYSNPLPHVLILTAIVVGVATLSVGLALVVRVRETYGSIEEEDLNLADHADDVREAAA